MPRTKSMGRAANGNGTIRKKSVMKNGKKYSYWEARCTVGYDPGTGKQIQRSISGKTQKEVAQKLKQMSLDVDNGTYQAPSNLTVKDWFEIWQKDYMGDVKASTKLLYSRNVDLYIVPNLGAVKLDSLTTSMIQKLYNQLTSENQESGKPLSPKTIKNIHGILHKALQQAVENGVIRVNPSDACKLPRVEKKDIQPLDDNQVSEFLKAVHGHPYEYLYKIALFTGIREGEVLGLTWECVDFQSNTLYINKQLQKSKKVGGEYQLIPTKNGKARLITVAPSVMAALKRQKVKQAQAQLCAGPAWENKEGFVFTNALGGHLAHFTVYKEFKKIVCSIGLDNARFHDLRHSYAVAAIESGDDIKTVQGNLGHATAAFTLNIYAHTTQKMRQQSADRMERFIQAVSGAK